MSGVIELLFLNKCVLLTVFFLSFFHFYLFQFFSLSKKRR